jgi:hypothetical protein
MQTGGSEDDVLRDLEQGNGLPDLLRKRLPGLLTDFPLFPASPSPRPRYNIEGAGYSRQREREEVNAFRAGCEEGAGGFAGGRSARNDVVDKEDSRGDR